MSEKEVDAGDGGGEDEAAQPSSTRDKVVYWFSVASANGFNRLVESKLTIRLFWLGVIVTSYFCMAAHLSLNFQQFFDYPVQIKIEYQSVGVFLPDITICRQGILKETHHKNEQLRFADAMYQFIYSNLNKDKGFEFDRLRFQSYNFARIAFFKDSGFSNGHIGQYLLFCDYVGEECSYLNFTLLRDPFFTNCFTFQPRFREIANAGKVLTLGLFIDDSSTRHDKDYLVTIHDRYTLPDIIHNHLSIREGGVTEVNFQVTNVSSYQRPTKPCKEKGILHYKYTGENNEFHYTKFDCFREKLQRTLLVECGCISAHAGITAEHMHSNTCFTLKNATKAEKKVMAFLRQRIEKRRGIETPLTTNETMIKREELNFKARMSIKKYLTSITNQFKCYQRVLRRLTLSYQHFDPPCPEACERNNINSWHTFHQFTNGMMTKAAEILMPERDELMKREKDLSSKNLTDNAMFKKMHSFVLRQITNFHSGKALRNKTLQRILNKESREKMAFLKVYADKVPGDQVVEEASYPFFSLLSDIGGNMGLWAGFSIISLFEVLELIFLVVGSKEKNVVHKKKSKAALEMNDNNKEKPLLTVKVTDNEKDRESIV